MATTSPALGFIGASGLMGHGMAKNLRAKGHMLALTVHRYRERVTDTHLAHIRNLPEVLPGLFADAAARAREAGFDGVELHYAHAYTMASFLSRTNTREDGFGGARENRVRLPLEVFSAVRERAGRDYVVGCRFLADECIAGGSDAETSARPPVLMRGETSLATERTDKLNSRAFRSWAW